MSVTFHHVALSVKNISDSARFYKLFGFKKSKYWQSPDKSLEIMLLNLGSVSLELFCCKKQKSAPKSMNSLEFDLQTIGTKHFALRVADLPLWRKRLKAAGVKIETDITQARASKFRYFFVRDPSNNFVELISFKK